MSDKPVQTISSVRETRCAHCGAGMEAAQGPCVGCGALSTGVWPPAVTAGPPDAGPARVRLLTGRSWLDEMLGWGLCWLLVVGLGKVLSLVESAYIAYVVRLPLSQQALPFSAPGLGLGAFALAAFAGTYLGLRRFSPKVGRGFGQNALFGGGAMLVFALWLEFFP